jgi:uncharacterized phage protein gp47/JayE
MSYGVTPSGFLKKTLADLLNEIESDERANISPTLNLLATSVFGQLNGIYGDKLRELWDVAEAVYRSQYPDSADGEALDQVSSITGATRLPATKSAIVLDRIHLDDGVSLPAGRLVSVGTAGARFKTTTSATNSTGAPATFSVLAESEDYGPILGLASTIDAIQTPVSGWKSNSALTCDNAEPYALNDGDTLDIKVDGGLVQTVTFNAGDFVDINNATASEVASVIDSALAGGGALAALTKVRIFTDEAGSGNSVQVIGGTGNTALGFVTTLIKGFNSLDATLGRDVETDASFRLRRIELLRITGAGTLEAIRAKVRELDDVLQAFIFENVTMVVDSNGLPPKSFEVVAAGGDDQEIADAIWLTKPAGIETFGSVAKTVIDTMGFLHTINFSRPTLRPIWMDLTVVKNPATFPTDGVDQIKLALKAFGDALQIGDDVIALQFRCVPLSVAGVEDVTIFKIDTVFPPVNTGNIVVAFRDLATFDTSRITVTVV